MAEKAPKSEIYRKAEEILDHFGVRPYTEEERQLIFDLAYDEAKNRPTFPSHLRPRSSTDILVPKSHALNIASGGSNNYAQAFFAKDQHTSIPGTEFDIPIPDGKKSFERREYANAQEFYATIVSLLEPTLKTIFSRVDRIDALGFVFSFPGTAIETNQGNVDILPDESMSKGYVVPGISQALAGESLVYALRDAGYPIGNIPYIVGNDGSTLGLGVPDARFAIIDGTGFNTARTIFQRDGSLRMEATESGDYLRNMPISRIEFELNQAGKHPGTYIAETICGGKSLESLMNRIISVYESEGLLHSVGPISGPQISQLIGHRHPIKGFEQYIPANQDIWNILRKPATAFRDRAVDVLTAITAATFIAHPNLLANYDVPVAMEGSTLLYIPGLAAQYTTNIQSLFKDNNFQFISSSSVYGAGFAALRAHARSKGNLSEHCQ